MSAFNDRRKKYSHKVKPQNNRIRFNFDLIMMDMFCSYALSQNISIHRNSQATLLSIFNAMDESIFENNPALTIRFRFVKDVLQARLTSNVSIELIIRQVTGMIGNKYSDLDMNSFKELSNDDVAWAEKTISNCANLLFINNSVLDLGNLCSEFGAADYNHKLDVVERIQEQVGDMQNKFRKNSVDSDDLNNTIKFDDLDNSMADIYSTMEQSTVKLRTGMQGFNNITAGGVEGGRVYSLFGLPGDGKTITLANLAVQLKKYNKNYVCKDKTKRPAIVFLTMENAVRDIVKIFFNIVTHSNRPMEDYTLEDATAILNEALGCTEDDPITIIVKYKPINSVNTSYLYKLTDDLSDEGYEVICLIQDYIKRIRPVDYVGDMRLDLGSVINDFHNYATFYDIPVLTASQFNREGVRIVDESRNNNRHDLVSKLGRAMIGESGLIEENLDCSIFLTREVSKEGQEFMGFKLAKHRYNIFTKDTTFYQPFHPECAISYMEDEGCAEPIYRTNLLRDEVEFKKTFGDTIVFQAGGAIEEIIEDDNTDKNKNDKPKNSTKREGLDSIIGGTVISSEDMKKKETKEEVKEEKAAAFRPMYRVCVRVKEQRQIGNMWQVVERVA